MRAMARAIFAVALLPMGGSPAVAASCDWGTPELVTAESSVPDGVSTASKEIAIGQPFASAVAAIDREFPLQRNRPEEISFNIDGKCQIDMSLAYAASASRAGRSETLTAQFASPRRGSQLLGFERLIRYDGVQLPLVSGLLEELKESFGDPSASKSWSTIRYYYFVYADRKKMSETPSRNSYPAWHRCVDLMYGGRKLRDLAAEAGCDFIVAVDLDLFEMDTDPRIERYKQAKIRFFDVKRARVDQAAQQDWIKKLKVEFARPEETPRRREFTPEPLRR